MSSDSPPLRELPHRAALSLRAALEARVALSLTEVRDGRDVVVWVSPEFERISGYNAEDLIGKDMAVLQTPMTDQDAVDALNRAIRSGETATATLLNRRWDGSPFWNTMVISPVLDDDGVVTHRVGHHTDSTVAVQDRAARAVEIERAARRNTRLQLLGDITQELITVLDINEGACRLATLTAEHFGDWATVVLAEGIDTIHQVHVRSRHDDPAHLAATAVLRDRGWTYGSPALMNALSGRESLVSVAFDIDPDIVDDIPDPEHRAAIRTLGAARAIVIPLHGREGLLGALAVLAGSPDALDDDDVRDLVHLGARAGLALDNARLYEREHDVAVTLQRSLLPQIVQAPGLDCAAVYEPASHGQDVGGDWYDVVPLPDGSVSVSVGDVVGHDIAAAAAMGQLRSSLRVEAWAGHSCAAVVDAVDELTQSLAMTSMATCVLAHLTAPDSAGTRRLHYTRAGHLAPLLIDADGNVRVLDDALTTPLGIPASRPAPEAVVTLGTGSSLVLFTDGLVERRDRSLPDGLAALRAAAAGLGPGRSAREIADALMAATDRGQREDDTCVLVVRLDPEAVPTPPSPAVPPTSRRA